MTEIEDPDGPTEAKPDGLVLSRRAIEKVFTDCVMDLKRILVLDGIDILPDGFRVRCHDLYGPLPEIAINSSGDTFNDKDRLSTEVCKIIVMVKLRDEMVCFLPECELLPPTSTDGKVIVGLQAAPRTWIIEGKGFLSAYHKLHRQVCGLSAGTHANECLE